MPFIAIKKVVSMSKKIEKQDSNNIRSKSCYAMKDNG
jgi:hypothetical protein